MVSMRTAATAAAALALAGSGLGGGQVAAKAAAPMTHITIVLRANGNSYSGPSSPTHPNDVPSGQFGVTFGKRVVVVVVNKEPVSVVFTAKLAGLHARLAPGQRATLTFMPTLAGSPWATIGWGIDVWTVTLPNGVGSSGIFYVEPATHAVTYLGIQVQVPDGWIGKKTGGIGDWAGFRWWDPEDPTQTLSIGQSACVGCVRELPGLRKVTAQTLLSGTDEPHQLEEGGAFSVYGGVAHVYYLFTDGVGVNATTLAPGPYDWVDATGLEQGYLIDTARFPGL